MTLHPATQKALVRELFREVPVVTEAQLYWLGLLPAAGWLGAGRVDHICRTRVNQKGSATRLWFRALNAEILEEPAHVLMHLAGVAELRMQLGELDAGARFAVVDLAGRGQGNQPDAELLLGGPNDCNDVAIEFDAGYPVRRADEKLTAFAMQGYRRIIWATSVHGRVVRLLHQAAALRRAGQLPGVERVEVRFVDFWSAGEDPYARRARCSKRSVAHVTWAQ